MNGRSWSAHPQTTRLRHSVLRFARHGKIELLRAKANLVLECLVLGALTSVHLVNFPVIRFPLIRTSTGEWRLRSGESGQHSDPSILNLQTQFLPLVLLYDKCSRL